MIRESTVEKATNLISFYDRYLDFAFELKANSDAKKPNGSLEDIHNDFHGKTGGDGHM